MRVIASFLLPIIVGAAVFFGIGFVQQITCDPIDSIGRRQRAASLLKDNSCEVEVRPGKWISRGQVNRFEELCK